MLPAGAGMAPAISTDRSSRARRSSPCRPWSWSKAARPSALRSAPAELALACASHGGEALHVDAVRRWLARLGLDQASLECGAHPPLHGPSAERLLVAGRAPEPVHNNCSGKHTAMLASARHLGAPLAGYTQPDHPVQRRVAAALAAMAGVDALPAPGLDGCGLPTWPLTLGQLATAMARLADPAGLPRPGAPPAARSARR